MPVSPDESPFAPLSQKWSALAARREAHFLELYSSGRWRHYYSEEEFLARMREVVGSAGVWAKLAARGASAALEPGQ
jgi:uncharacterized repeat protein (TIGR03809 family)